MLETYGHAYFRTADALATARGKLHAWKLGNPDKTHVYSGNEVHTLVISALGGAASLCERVPLGTLSREISRTAKECERSLIVERCGLALRNIAERFHDELGSRLN